MPPELEEAIHLVAGSAARGQLIGAGARQRIFGSDDTLTSGPCSVDPVQHAELRRTWDAEAAPQIRWRRPPGLADLRTVTAGDEPIVVWGTRAFSDLVWLWWVLDGLRRIGVEGPRCFLARPASEEPFLTVGHFPPETARATLAAARPITDDEWREAGELWTRYASPSPLAFDEARRTGSSAFPELTSSADLHGAWFPRLDDGRLHLSELDEVLLAGLDDTWRTPQDIHTTLPQLRQEHLGTFDGYFVLERLRAWATHGVLERDLLADANPFKQDRFRAPPSARTLLANGLEHVGNAPPMYIGGCRINDPASPWVRIASASGWQLAAQAAR